MWKVLEYHVLKGAVQLLLNHQPILFIEIHNVRTMHSVLDLLHLTGYHALSYLMILMPRVQDRHS